MPRAGASSALSRARRMRGHPGARDCRISWRPRTSRGESAQTSSRAGRWLCRYLPRPSPTSLLALGNPTCDHSFGGAADLGTVRSSTVRWGRELRSAVVLSPLPLHTFPFEDPGSRGPVANFFVLTLRILRTEGSCGRCPRASWPRSSPTGSPVHPRAACTVSAYGAHTLRG